MTNDIWVTVDHIHSVPAWNGKSGYCNQVAREFCARNNISWSDLINNGGLWGSELEKTGDALAIHLVNWVRSLGQIEQSHDRLSLRDGPAHGAELR